MSAPPATTNLAAVNAQPGLQQQQQQPPSGATLAQDFQQTYGDGTGAAAQQGGHYNRITKRWEGEHERPELSSEQNASTCPEEIGEPIKKPSFKEQVMGNAKVFAGKTWGREHEVATGEALLRGDGKDEAIKVGEAVRQQEGQ